MDNERKVILVCGGRNYKDEEYVFRVLNAISNPTLIVHGGCSGADLLADKWAKANNVPVKAYPADWSVGKAAGPIRNQQMLDEEKPDMVVAFPGGNGTRDMINKARKANVAVAEV